MQVTRRPSLAEWAKVYVAETSCYLFTCYVCSMLRSFVSFIYCTYTIKHSYIQIAGGVVMARNTGKQLSVVLSFLVWDDWGGGPWFPVSRAE